MEAEATQRQAITVITRIIFFDLKDLNIFKIKISDSQVSLRNILAKIVFLAETEAAKKKFANYLLKILVGKKKLLPLQANF
jgi:hypothetical protein